MKEHLLKTLAPYWDALSEGKTFEVRRDDRGFQKGDHLILRRMSESNPYVYDRAADTLRDQRFKVTYVLTGGQLGIEPGYVVMGIKAL